MKTPKNPDWDNYSPNYPKFMIQNMKQEITSKEKPPQGRASLKEEGGGTTPSIPRVNRDNSQRTNKDPLTNYWGTGKRTGTKKLALGRFTSCVRDPSPPTTSSLLVEKPPG